MEKQVIGSMGMGWQMRMAVVDRNYLYFAKDDNPDYVLDYIPLHEITSISITQVPADPYELAKTKVIQDHLDALKAKGMNLTQMAAQIATERPLKPDAAAVLKAAALNQVELRLLIETCDDGHNAGRPYRCECGQSGLGIRSVEDRETGMDAYTCAPRNLVWEGGVWERGV